MKYLGEVAVFVLLLVLAIGVVFLLLLASNPVVYLRTSQAAWLALIAVFFWLPAAANVHLALRARPASRRARATAACRAFGMLLCSAAVGCWFLAGGVGSGTAVAVFLAGAALNFGTLAFDS